MPLLEYFQNKHTVNVNRVIRSHCFSGKGWVFVCYVCSFNEAQPSVVVSAKTGTEIREGYSFCLFCVETGIFSKGKDN